MTPSAWVLLLPYFPGGKCIQTGVSKSELGDGVWGWGQVGCVGSSHGGRTNDKVIN